ncbi:hypothetical protein ACLOJK_016775 [Asimina triloba]
MEISFADLFLGCGRADAKNVVVFGILHHIPDTVRGAALAADGESVQREGCGGQEGCEEKRSGRKPLEEEKKPPLRWDACLSTPSSFSPPLNNSLVFFSIAENREGRFKWLLELAGAVAAVAFLFENSFYALVHLYSELQCSAVQ